MVRRSLAGRKFGIKSPWHPVTWVPHFLHMSKEGVITQYVPSERQVEEHQGNVWKFWLDLWHFEGHIVSGDFECRLAWQNGGGDEGMPDSSGGGYPVCENI